MEDKNEQTEAKASETVSTEENTDNGDEPKTTTLIGDANLAAKRLEEANKEKKANLDREERLLAESKLAGVGAGAQKAPQQTEEAKKVDGAKKFFKGTSIEDAITKANE